MSNTIRNQDWKQYFRHPKGFKNAKINGVRVKAVPPDDREDLNRGHDCYGMRANAGKKKNPRINGG